MRASQSKFKYDNSLIFNHPHTDPPTPQWCDTPSKRNGLARTNWIGDGPKGNAYDAGDLDTLSRGVRSYRRNRRIVHVSLYS